MPRGMNQGAISATSPAAGTLAFPPRHLSRNQLTRLNDSPTTALSQAARAELNWIASEGSPSLSRHARIILARHEDRSLSEIAHILDIDRATVRRWLLRFERQGLQGLVHASTGKIRKRRFN